MTRLGIEPGHPCRRGKHTSPDAITLLVKAPYNNLTIVYTELLYLFNILAIGGKVTK